MSTYYPPGYGRVQGPSGATGGLGSTQTGYRDPMRRRLARPAGPAPVPPQYSLGSQGNQLSDILREAALQRRMQGPTEQPPFAPVTTDAMLQEPPMDLTQQPIEPMGPPPTGGPFEDVMADPQQFEQMMQDAALQGRIQGRRQVGERRSVADTVNDVSNAIQRRLAELTQGVLR